MSDTSNIGLYTPVNGDPAILNSWGAAVCNVNMGLVDDYTAGSLSKSVAGSANVVLAYSDGASSDARHSSFNFTGALTGDIVVLWPNAKEMNFSVQNNTTGAYTLSLGVDNGSGSPAGTTVIVPTGGSLANYRSDGTNVVAVGSNISTPVALTQGGTGATTASGARTNLGLGTAATVNTGTSGATIPLNDGANTLSGANTLTGSLTISNTPVSSSDAGFRGIPANAQSSNYQLALTDNGQCIEETSGTASTLTIAANGTTAYPVGFTASILVTGAGTVTVAAASGVTLIWAGNGGTGNRSVPQYAWATVRQTNTLNTWVITGAGIS